MVASKVASLERLQDILNRLHLKKVERQEEMESQVMYQCTCVEMLIFLLNSVVDVS